MFLCYSRFVCISSVPVSDFVSVCCFLASDLPLFLLWYQILGNMSQHMRFAVLNVALTEEMKKVNKQCLLDTPRTVRVSEKT